MTYFNTYLTLGLQHILNIQALDHLLFILSLTCIYRFSDSKNLFFLITAFTLGHSLTLALATLGWIQVSMHWIEFLIPCTILISAIGNFTFKDSGLKKQENSILKYILVGIFGLIHGLGFSNYLQSLLGKESSIVGPLFAFNVGLEIGQIVVVISILIISSLLIRLIKIKMTSWVLVISGIVIGLVIPMIVERW
ncbi:HupE/UreJ family protein [Aquirufa nivalisilvae]|uniref:HupE/UreJ family protein n=1 Tax=Aquirufa nivalisilvae TaxID=2516557 RepID=UPI0010329B9D|nr:HupE/UreJ family protein [Aquirufa nivalisilvae]TBH70964.1 HupE/UreJ family protein [Aquirufa nivalisilvae]